MRQFFKFTFASCLGVFLAGICLFLFMISVVTSLAKSKSGDDTVHEVMANSILELKFEQPVPELTGNQDETSPLVFLDKEKKAGLTDIVYAINHATTDSRIKGIILDERTNGLGFTQLKRVRDAVEKFRASGKFVWAYADMYSQGAYYLASVADSVMLNPNGDVELKGIAAQLPFMKSLFDRLGVKWQIYYAGQYKSATEPLRLDKMSDQNKLQTREYISALYGSFLSDISKSRNIAVSELATDADELLVRRAGDALKYKLVDGVGYYDEFLTALHRKLGIGVKTPVNSVSIDEYTHSYERNRGEGSDRIAVVYAEGTIDYGGDTEKDGQIEGLRYAKMIRKLRNDESVKAIVLRVNSGGGSAVASDMIWRELDLCRKQGKPVIASFGDVAASGGYYIAMAADSIFAEPNTITGSIGVFSAIPSVERALKEKLGVAFDSVRTGKYAAGINLWYDQTPEEAKMLQESTDTIYEKFLNRVGTCRKMSRDQVHAVAQGRVWMATKAKDNGLIDKIGGLNEAIAAAASKANLKKYHVSDYPKQGDKLEMFINRFTKKQSDNDFVSAALRQQFGEEYTDYLDLIQRMTQMKQPQMRLPLILHIK